LWKTIALAASFKGTVSRDFRLLVFFIKQSPSRALIHGLKPFRIRIRIRRQNRLCNRQNRLPRPDRPLKPIFLLEFPFNRYVFL
jgi:hypothetical protein